MGVPRGYLQVIPRYLALETQGHMGLQVPAGQVSRGYLDLR